MDWYYLARLTDSIGSQEPTPLSPLSFPAIRNPESVMAEPVGHNQNTILIAAGAVIALLLVLLTIGGGHNNGQPSAPSGPGAPMQTDQGR
jgi:hypothetical protein